MNLLKHLLCTGMFLLVSGHCSENTSSTQHEGEPSIAETLVQIANDPGAGAGGDR